LTEREEIAVGGARPVELDRQASSRESCRQHEAWISAQLPRAMFRDIATRNRHLLATDL